VAKTTSGFNCDRTIRQCTWFAARKSTCTI